MYCKSVDSALISLIVTGVKGVDLHCGSVVPPGPYGSMPNGFVRIEPEDNAAVFLLFGNKIPIAPKLDVSMPRSDELKNTIFPLGSILRTLRLVGQNNYKPEIKTIISTTHRQMRKAD
jgi:hypothetical protein